MPPKSMFGSSQLKQSDQKCLKNKYSISNKYKNVQPPRPPNFYTDDKPKVKE